MAPEPVYLHLEEPDVLGLLVEGGLAPLQDLVLDARLPLQGLNDGIGDFGRIRSWTCHYCVAGR